MVNEEITNKVTSYRVVQKNVFLLEFDYEINTMKQLPLTIDTFLKRKEQEDIKFNFCNKKCRLQFNLEFELR